MKNLHITFFFFWVSFCIFAQKSTRVAYVDVAYILQNLEEYRVANEQFAEKIATWQAEFDEKLEEIRKRKEKLDAEKPLLTAEMVSDREEEIQILEHNLKVLQQKRFGAENGDYIQQKWQLAQPIEDQIFNIAQEIGKTKKYDYIFTKEDVSSIYADQKYDITKLVLRILKRKENAEDRNKEMSELLKENYNYDLKDERTKKREEVEQKRAKLYAERQAQREAKQKELAAQREKALQERQAKRTQLELEKKQTREKNLKEKESIKSKTE